MLVPATKNAFEAKGLIFKLKTPTTHSHSETYTQITLKDHPKCTGVPLMAGLPAPSLHRARSGVTIWSKIDFKQDFRNLLFALDFRNLFRGL